MHRCKKITRRRILHIGLILLMLLMPACGNSADAVPGTTQGYESEENNRLTQTASPGESTPEISQESESEVQEPQVQEPQEPQEQEPQESSLVTEEPQEDEGNDNLPTYGDYYYDLENVVLYLELYDELPPNYITKNEARDLGWEGGSVEKYQKGAAIGGDTFGNREGLLPAAGGRKYTECDIGTKGRSSRGSKRLVFSNDGLYFYTSDHYETFSEVTVTEEYEVIW